jgi:hypothetical protein
MDKLQNIIEHTLHSDERIMGDIELSAQPNCCTDERYPAINVKQECADVYYAYFDSLPDRLKKKLSVEMLAEIFRTMVVPTIDKARALDREHREI